MNDSNLIVKWQPHDFLTNILGSDLLESIPVIEIENGSTDYLDRVRPKDFVDAEGKPVFMAKGIDMFKRHFVTFGAVVKDEENKEAFVIYTLFRRYTDDNSVWVCCRSHCSESMDYILSGVLNCQTTVGPESVEMFKKFFDMYKNGNSGMDASCEIYDYDVSKFVEKRFNIRFYSPSERQSKSSDD